MLAECLRARRGNAARFDTALRWCWLEFLGWQPDNFQKAPSDASQYIAQQLRCRTSDLKVVEGSTIRNRNAFIRREAGWRDLTLQDENRLKMFLVQESEARPSKHDLLSKAIEWCHGAKITRPGLTVLERLIANVATDVQDRFNQSVIVTVDKTRRRQLLAAAEKLITNPSTQSGWIDLQQLKAPPVEPSERNLNRLLDNIEFMHKLGVGGIDLSHLSAARRQEYVKDAMRMSPADLRDLNKPRRLAMVICLLVDLWTSHHNYAPQMHQRILKESRDRAEGKRRKSVMARLGDIFRYLRLLAEVFRIVRNAALSDRQKVARIMALTSRGRRHHQGLRRHR